MGEAAIFVPVLLFLPQDESVVPAVGRHVETVGRREQLSAWLTATVAEAANRDVISARYWYRSCYSLPSLHAFTRISNIKSLEAHFLSVCYFLIGLLLYRDSVTRILF